MCHILRILSPLVDQGLHVSRKWGIEADHLLRAWMNEAKGLGMESLTRQKLETILDELTILRIDCTLADFSTIIAFIIEERMTDPVEMHTDLMGTACLKTTLDNCYIAEALKDSIMCNSVLSMIALRENLETHTIVRITADITYDCTLVFLKITPYDGNITALDRVNKELLCMIELSLLVLSYNKKT